MKKVLCLMMVLVMCCAMAVNVFAAEDDFVPSISYKDAPELGGADLEGEDVASFLIITSILDAINNATDISEEARAELLYVYQQIMSGKMTLPLSFDYVIRDMFDISLSDPHYEHILEQDHVYIKVTFKLGDSVPAGLHVLQYDDHQWWDVPYVDNGDGTITATFEDFCPVVFAVESQNHDGPTTGDNIPESYGLWVGIMAVSAIAVVAVVCNRRKIFG